MHNPSIQQAAAELDRIASDPALRAQALNRKMAILDHASAMREARLIAYEQTALNLLREGTLSIPVIAQATTLSEERVREIARDAQLPS